MARFLRQFTIANAPVDWQGYSDNFTDQKNEISALQSFYEKTDDFDILEEASIEDKTLYLLQCRVHMDIKEKPINMEIWLPIEKVKENKIDVENPENNKRPILERSVSGQRAHTSIKCDYLPPIILDILLPPTYPSSTQPLFTLSCSWLNQSQIENICSQLDKIWTENHDLPIIYQWIEWLEKSTLEFLDSIIPPNKILVTPYADETSTNKKPMPNKKRRRGFCEFDDIENCIFNIIKFNIAQEAKSFRSSVQQCLVCYEEKMGKDCIRLNNCKHHFCEDCLSVYCKMHVNDGTIQKLKCPDAECQEFISEDLMQIVLTETEFERWRRLRDQRNLDMRKDIIYCPKCSDPIKIDEFDNHAYCTHCLKDFCKLCKDNFHVDKCKTIEEKFQERLADLNLDVTELLEMNETQIKSKFKHPEFVFQMLEKVRDTNENNSLLRTLLRCPKCYSPIEKVDGCNKVVCLCNTIICYLCGKEIPGYEHFDDGVCQLWTYENSNENERDDDEDDDYYEIHHRNVFVDNNKVLITVCPSCGNRDRKFDTNNHIKCKICRTNYCFSCKKKIFGVITAHFKVGGCKQHTAD